MSSGTLPATAGALPTILGVVTVLTSSAGLWLFLRQWLRTRAENNRYRWAERLADKHGPDVLAQLPELAGILRDGPSNIPGEPPAQDGSEGPDNSSPRPTPPGNRRRR